MKNLQKVANFLESNICRQKECNKMDRDDYDELCEL